MGKRPGIFGKLKELSYDRSIGYTDEGQLLGHILIDGAIEPHAATEGRLLGPSGAADDLFGGGADRLAEAYRARARKVAAHLVA